MRVTVTYRLSEAGQRAAIAAGLPAQSIQTIEGEAPIEALDLVTIDAEGHASIDLTKSYYASNGACSTFDAPQTLDQIILWMRFYNERIAQEKREKQAADLRQQEEARAEFQRQLAIGSVNTETYAEGQIYLGNYGDHANKICVRRMKSEDLAFAPTAEERAEFDRIREANIAQRKAEEQAHKAAQEAEYRAKQEADRAVKRAWIVEHAPKVIGWAQSMLERFDAGVLPTSEFTRAVEAWLFADLDDMPRYKGLTRNDITHSDECDECADNRYSSKEASEVPAEVWDAAKAIRACLREGDTSVIRRHSAWCYCDHCEGITCRYGLSVGRTWNGEELEVSTRSVTHFGPGTPEDKAWRKLSRSEYEISHSLRGACQDLKMKRPGLEVSTRSVTHFGQGTGADPQVAESSK